MSVTPGTRMNFSASRSRNKRQNVARNHRCVFNILFTVLIISFITNGKALEEVDAISDLQRLRDCTLESNDTVTLEIEDGWPFLIDCDQQYEKYVELSYYNYEEDMKLNDTTYECITTSEDKIIRKEIVSGLGDDMYSFHNAYSAPYAIPAVSHGQNGTSYSSYMIGGNACFKFTYKLLVKEPRKQESCSTVPGTGELTIERKLTKNKLYELLCIASGKDFNLLPETYNITWYKDCVEIKNTIGTKQLGYQGDYPLDIGRLLIEKANFDTTPGEYSCSVTYNGKTKFLNKNKVCVQYKQIGGPPNYSQMTSSSVQPQEGSDVTLTCGGYPGRSFMGISFLVMWYKNNTNGSYDSVCSSHLFTTDGEIGNDEKYKCNLLSNVNETSTCYTNSTEAAKDKLQGLVKINSSLIIRNFKNSDSGRYVCKVISTISPVEVSFDVEEKKSSILIIALPILAGIFLLLLLVISLCVCFQRRVLKKQQQKLQKESIDQKEPKGNNNNSYIPELHKKSLPLEV